MHVIYKNTNIYTHTDMSNECTWTMLFIYITMTIYLRMHVQKNLNKCYTGSTKTRANA